MDVRAQLAQLEVLLRAPDEDECLEFKTAATQYNFEKLGEYFSALSNEANLRGLSSAWLVMGVDNDRKVVGTLYKNHHASLQKLKRDIAPHTALNFTFESIYAVRHASGKRVLMFQIPAAPCGVPMSWKGHFFGRDHESTVALKQNEYDTIRGQASLDWSGTICSEATLENDIDAAAVLKAREGFKEKNARLSAECDAWSDATFLSKTKLLRAGKLTYAALLLVGKAESSHFLSPVDASIFWVRKRADGTNADYESFAPPFVLSVDDLFARVKNDRHQFMRDGTLFPIDILQYDGWVIREMLHNAIAHQDYRQNRRINVVEQDGKLQFTNAGSFQPGSVEKVVEENRPQDHFRNRCLVDAMRSINMIETLGSGIPRVYRLQRQRGFPMTDYDLSEPRTVAVTVYGQVLDENYTRVLLSRPELELRDVIALDKVQKGIRLDAHAFARLRERKLVEGKRIAARVVAHLAAGGALADNDIGEAIIVHLRAAGGAGKSSVITQALLPRMSPSLGEVQKTNKVRNALQTLSREGRIENVGRGGRGAVWKLLE